MYPFNKHLAYFRSVGKRKLAWAWVGKNPTLITIPNSALVCWIHCYCGEAQNKFSPLHIYGTLGITNHVFRYNEDRQKLCGICLQRGAVIYYPCRPTNLPLWFVYFMEPFDDWMLNTTNKYSIRYTRFVCVFLSHKLIMLHNIILLFTKYLKITRLCK